jgi:sulfite reductase alpha subunit
MAKHATPMLDQLESGPWPSFVSDLKQQAARFAHRIRGNIEYQIPVGRGRRPAGRHGALLRTWHGPTGNTAASSASSDTAAALSAGIATSPKLRSRAWPTFTPCGSTSRAANSTKPNFLKNLCDLWEFRGSGITNMHGSTGDIIFLGTTTPQLEDFLRNDPQVQPGPGRLRLQPADPGRLRRPGPLRVACYDTQACATTLTQEYQDELHRPAFPYKFKFKFDGCPNCCVASIARSDLSFIGTWKDDIKIDQEAVAAYIGGEFRPQCRRPWSRLGPFDIQKEVIDLCPTDCMWMEDGKLKIDNKECTRCMHCINVMPRALRIGDDRGESILAGAKAPILDGAQMGSLMVPFIKVEAPYTISRECHRAHLGLVDGRRAKTVNVSAS